MSIPQNAIPITIEGHPYLVEIDEFAGGGASRANGRGRRRRGSSTSPTRRTRRCVSNLRLEVHQPENRAAHRRTTRARSNPVQGYAGHYCNVPQRVDPGIVACSMILSGPAGVRHPRPGAPAGDRLLQRARQPRSSRPPASTPPATRRCRARRSCPSASEIWYSDGTQRLLRGEAHEPAARSRREEAAPGRAAASPSARRSARATSAGSGSASPASGCARCPFSRCARRGLPSATACGTRSEAWSPSSGAAASRPQTGRQPVRRVVGDRQRLLVRLERDRHRHGPEDLLLADAQRVVAESCRGWARPAAGGCGTTSAPPGRRTPARRPPSRPPPGTTRRVRTGRPTRSVPSWSPGRAASFPGRGSPRSARVRSQHFIPDRPIDQDPQTRPHRPARRCR